MNKQKIFAVLKDFGAPIFEKHVGDVANRIVQASKGLYKIDQVKNIIWNMGTPIYYNQLVDLAKLIHKCNDKQTDIFI